jgi:Uma2 family endonuclease
MSSAEQPEYMSVDQYLALENGTQYKSEYIDGWVRAMIGPTLRHNLVKGNCFLALGNFLKGKSCRPFDSDTKIRIDREGMKRFYYPDVQVVCESNQQTSVFQDNPLLIIEVLSPSTRRYDLDEKMTAYLSIPSLQYYLVLEQHQPIAIIMRRTAKGFLREEVQGIDAMIELPWLGYTLAMRDIYDGIEFTDNCVQETETEYECNYQP